MERVLITHRLPGERVRELERLASVDTWQSSALLPAPELLRIVPRCSGIVCMLTDRIDEQFFHAATSLRFLSSVSVGVDHIDLAAATARGIPVGHTPGVLVDATADATFGLVLATARRIPEADRFVRAGRWTADNRWSPDFFTGVELRGATLGILGLGAIGRAVASRAAPFGMNVIGWNRTPMKPAGITVCDRDEVLARADILCVCVALTAETRGMIATVELARMKQGAILINTARGGIVDEVALADALTSGHLAAAGIDVFAQEPLAPDSPLLSAPNTVLTPHLGSATRYTRARMADLAADNLIDALSGRPMRCCANPEVYES